MMTLCINYVDKLLVFFIHLPKDKLQEWMEALIFENLKPVEITKKLFQYHLNTLKKL